MISHGEAPKCQFKLAKARCPGGLPRWTTTNCCCIRSTLALGPVANHDIAIDRALVSPTPSSRGSHWRRWWSWTGILSVCRSEKIGFTAIVRSRPERITDLWHNSRVAVVGSLADRDALVEAFSGADAVLTAIGLTSTSFDTSALLSVNMPTVEASMNTAGVSRIIVINTLLASLPGKPASRNHALFLMDARYNRTRSCRTASSGRCPWLRCVFLVALRLYMRESTHAVKMNAQWRQLTGRVLRIPGCPSHINQWPGGCLRRRWPMRLSAKPRLCRGDGGKCRVADVA